ncbi:MAG: hypothetical protein QGH25_23935, partial [Candidatus Latescibacteria bacterium]|nr:hypothetical protein [Candidatus Latescibacterota bacterium]
MKYSNSFRFLYQYCIFGKLKIIKEDGMDKIVVLAIGMMLLISACGDPPLEPRLEYYVAAQEALAADEFVRAQQALGQLKEHVDGALGEEVAATAAAEDIGAMRLAFRPLSDRLVKALAVPEGYSLAYCLMIEGDKKGYWIQKEGEVMNPYFGASML